MKRHAATARRARTLLRAASLCVLLDGAAGPAALAQPASNEAAAFALRTSQAAIGHRTADHRFVDQDGRPLQLAQLRDRPLVVSFVFTNCYVVCSGLTVHLRDVVRIARDALGDRSFAVLTVGFDSAHDTPARMRAYARDRGIGDADWHFVSADAATVRAFTDELGFTWAPSARGFDHVTQVTLLDPGGSVVRQVYGEAFDPPELVEPLKQLVLRGSVDRGPVRGIIERVRLYCSVYDPAARRYRFDYSMLAAGLPLLLVFGMVAAAIVFAGRRTR